MILEATDMQYNPLNELRVSMGVNLKHTYLTSSTGSLLKNLSNISVLLQPKT